MPIYEYECSSCKHKFETLQAITEEPKSKCPQCGKKLKKLIGSSAGFIFKNSSVPTCPKAMALAKGGQTMALRPNQGCAGCL